MRKSLLEKLCCPMDKNELRIQTFEENENEEIIEGLLTCIECNRYYPIIHGIPIMTPDEYRVKSLEESILNKWDITLNSKNTGSFLLEPQV